VTFSYYRPTVAEINLDAITHNVAFFKNHLSKKVELTAVVKADAYGHGAVPVVKHLQTIGIHSFAVAFLDEAIELRKAGIDDPILVLGYTPKEGVETAIRHHITLTIFSDEMIESIHQEGMRLGEICKVHIKVDTGMGRIGLPPEEVSSFILQLQRSPWIKVEGIFTHFATADEKDKSFTMQQYNTFQHVVEQAKKIVDIPYIHVANSAALIDLPDLNQTMGRLGISLYGLLPSREVSIHPEQLKPVMSLKTKIVYLKKLKPGQTVSYGATFKAKKETLVATLPIGYADGLSRSLSNKGYVLVQGQKAPIIGRVCMDQTMIDVTHIPHVSLYDEVVIFGMQQGQYLSIDEHAKMLNTINYELVTFVGKRIPRIYRKDGKIIEVKNRLLE